MRRSSSKFNFSLFSHTTRYARRPRPAHHYCYRPLLQYLEARCLLSGIPQYFDTWMGYDTADYSISYSAPLNGGVADLDNDGDPEILAANSDTMSVIRNIGDGTYGQPAYYSTGVSLMPRDIATGDFDGDGYSDAVLTETGNNWNGTTVSVLRNKGDGTFFPRQAFAAGNGVNSVAAADFDRDGHLDLAVSKAPPDVPNIDWPGVKPINQLSEFWSVSLNLNQEFRWLAS